MATTNIGSITACIAHDHRYTTRVIVDYDYDTSSVVVTQEMNGAISGMDGPGGSYPFDVRKTIRVQDPTPALVISAIKSCFDDTIKTYGKPSKNFGFYVWDEHGRRVVKRGLNQKLARAALERVVSLHH